MNGLMTKDMNSGIKAKNSETCVDLAPKPSKSSKQGKSSVSNEVLYDPIPQGVSKIWQVKFESPFFIK